jgi:hypothetical protein
MSAFASGWVRKALLPSALLGGVIVGGFVPVYLLAGDHPALAPWSRWYVLIVALLAVVCSYVTLTRCSGTRSLASRLARETQPLETPSREFIAVGGVALAYALATALANAYRWRIHTLGNVDSAIIVQSMRYTLDHGRLMFNTIEKASHFGVHNSPIYLATLPLYALLRDPKAFLSILPPIVISLSAFPMYAYARRRLVAAESLLLTIAYLLAPYIMARSTGNLYEMTLLPALLLWAILEFDRERLGAFVAASILCLAVKESIAATILIFAILSIVRRRSIAWVAAPAALSALSLALSYLVIFPAFGEGIGSRAGALLGALGNTPAEAIRFALTDPIAFLRLIATPQKVGLVYQIAQPLLFLLPLLSGEALLALPALALNLLAQGGSTGIRAWESAGFGPVLYASAVGGITWLSTRASIAAWFGSSRAAARFLVIGVLFATLGCAPYWLRVNEYQRSQRWAARAAAIEMIPPEASLSTPDYMLARFAERDHLQLQTGPPYWAEYHLVDQSWIDEVRGHRIPERTAREYEALALDGAPELELIWSQDDIYLFRRRGQ